MCKVNLRLQAFLINHQNCAMINAKKWEKQDRVSVFYFFYRQLDMFFRMNRTFDVEVDGAAYLF